MIQHDGSKRVVAVGSSSKGASLAGKAADRDVLQSVRLGEIMVTDDEKKDRLHFMAEPTNDGDMVLTYKTEWEDE